MADNQRFTEMLDYLKNSRIIRNQQDFTERVGSDKATISQIKNGKLSIPNKLFNKIEEAFPSISTSWLMTGEGPMLKTEEEQGGTMVPLLPVAAAAGSLDGFAASVRLQDCEKVASPIKGVDFVMPVVGDSMEPEYPSGAMLFIKKVNEKLFLEWGKVYVLDTENGSVVKKLMPTEKEGVVECISLNPKYPPFKVDLSCAYGVYRVLLCMMRK